MDSHECLIESSDKLNVLQAVTIPARELPVLAAADVVVCGGGPAGIAAALAASRAGRRVILLEQTGMLGGMGTAGLVPAIIVMDDGERVLADGICREVQSSLRVMPACFITGQAAGAAAALAADSSKGEVRSVKMEQLQNLLHRQGAYVQV